MIRRPLGGIDAVERALAEGVPLSVVLVREGVRSHTVEKLLERLRCDGVRVLEESDREMRRMAPEEGAREPVGTPEILALAGEPVATSLDALMRSDGPVFVLVDLRYPGNVGYILRCAEVAGAAGVVLSSDWGEAQREEALRVGMRPDRFFPVLDATRDEVLDSARRAGRRLVALETSGDVVPWQADLARPLALLVGGETTGLPDAWMNAADTVVRIPVAGFIPSYNVQAAVGIFLGEWMRQNPSALGESAS